MFRSVAKLLTSELATGVLAMSGFALVMRSVIKEGVLVLPGLVNSIKCVSKYRKVGSWFKFFGNIISCRKSRRLLST